MRTIQDPFVAPAYVHLSDWKYEDKVFHWEPSWIVTRLLLVTTQSNSVIVIYFGLGAAKSAH